MSIIEQSPGLVISALTKTLKKIVGTRISRGHLYWMKGAVPSSLENITNPNRYRAADRLVHWNRNQIIITQGLITTTASTPINSGVATWFYFYRIDGDKIYQLIGTITLTGQGGDLELANTTVFKDKTYGIQEPRQSISIIPTSATWNVEIPRIQSISVEPTSATWNVEITRQSISVVPTSETWNVEIPRIQSISVVPTSETWTVLP